MSQYSKNKNKRNRQSQQSRNQNNNSNKQQLSRKANPNQEPTVTMPASFVRSLMKQATYDPTKATSRKSYSYSIYTKENILSWLQSPSTTSSEKNLRNASNYMYLSSMQYNRLLNYYAGLYTGAYVISPLAFNKEEVKADSFKKQYRKVTKSLELMNIPKILRQITLVTLRDGAFYGVLASDSNSAFIYKIDADYCRITSICDGSFLYKVDMTYLRDKLEFYPAEFTAMYNEYLATGEKWQEVPIDISVCVKADDSIIDYTIPPFSAVMPSVYTIANTEALQETADELKNYKMISGKIPCDDKGNFLMDDAIITQYYNQIAMALDDRIGLALSPFDLESFSFEGSDGTSDVNEISEAISNFWSTAGTSGLLHGKENGTAGTTKLAIKNDETYVLSIVQQFERVINRYLKTNFSGTSKFKITILPITIYNKDEYLQYYKEAASFGIGKSLYAAALGVPQYDVGGLDYIEKELMPFDELEPLKSTYTTSSSSDEAGRPALDDEDLSEAGEETRGNDENANR